MEFQLVLWASSSHLLLILICFDPSPFGKLAALHVSCSARTSSCPGPLVLVCYKAVFGVITHGALHDDTKNGCVAD